MQDVDQLREDVQKIVLSDEVKQYVVDLVQATRGTPGVALGGSPRASLALMRVAKALALFDGLDFVTPDHIQEVAVEVIAHRLVIDPQARFSGVTAVGIVEDLLKTIPVPH